MTSQYTDNFLWCSLFQRRALIPFKTWIWQTLNNTSFLAWLPGWKRGCACPSNEKWFNTNYHYIVPKFEKQQKWNWLSQDFWWVPGSQRIGINTRPVAVDHLLSFNYLTLKMEWKQKTVDSLAAATKKSLQNWQSLVRLVIQTRWASSLPKICQLKKKPSLEPLTTNSGGQERPMSWFKPTGDVRDVYNDLVNSASRWYWSWWVKTLELVKGGFPSW